VNTLSQDPARRCKPVSEWPEGDQQRRAEALEQGTLLEDGGALASHSRSSLRGLDSGYGRWLQWLDNVGELDAAAPPASRVIRKRTAKYAETLLNMNGTGTVMERLRSLFYMCRALDPEQQSPY
jgi:hypothetical protein